MPTRKFRNLWNSERGKSETFDALALDEVALATAKPIATVVAAPVPIATGVEMISLGGRAETVTVEERVFCLSVESVTVRVTVKMPAFE